MKLCKISFSRLGLLVMLKVILLQNENKFDCSQFFHDEACTYLGNQIGYLQNVASHTKCQRSCQLSSKCSYFLYDYDVKDCQLFDADDRDCLVTVGPASPSFEECKTTITTTTTTTTTTTMITTTTTTTTTTTATTTTTTTSTTISSKKMFLDRKLFLYL